MSDTYVVVLLVKEDGHPEHKKVIKRGLTQEEAQAICSDPETSSSTATGEEAKALTERLGSEWFYGWNDEKRYPR